MTGGKNSENLKNRSKESTQTRHKEKTKEKKTRASKSSDAIPKNLKKNVIGIPGEEKE